MSTPYLSDALGVTLDDLAARDLPPVDVLVLDSGVDGSHPDLAGRVKAAFRVNELEDGEAEVLEKDVTQNNDAYGHGTAVAGIICRMAPHARIIDMGVLGKGNKGGGTVLLEGLKHAVYHVEPRVMNLSLAVASKFAQSVFKLTEKAYRKNQVVVASKRNLPLADMGFPAEFSSCVSVDNEEFSSPFHYLYRPGEIIEFAAHGEEVPVPAAGGGYTTMTGTSFATPAVSGVCAILTAAYPELRPFEVKALLKHYAQEEAEA